MGYRIDLHRSLATEVRRIALGELEPAIELLRDPDREGLEESVHSVRKHTKRLRSLIRLVEPALGSDARALHVAIRGAANGLSGLRDSQALVGTFDTLLRTQHEHLPPNRLAKVRSALVARADVSPSDTEVAECLTDAADQLTAIRDGVTGWSLPEHIDIALNGAADAYAHARTAFRRSVRKPSEPRMHEWRKRVKDGWYHTQLLRDLAPRALEPQQRWMADLSDALGDNNDLSVLTHLLVAEPAAFGGGQADQALSIIADVQGTLVDRCHRSGARLYAETGHTSAKRLRSWADVTDDFGREKLIGGIEAVYAPRP